MDKNKTIFKKNHLLHKLTYNKLQTKSSANQTNYLFIIVNISPHLLMHSCIYKHDFQEMIHQILYCNLHYVFA